MRSYTWAPGHIYGEWKEPKYNAISYTWGRFELKQGQLPDVSSVKFERVDWQIPRIDPTHFTKGELHQVLKRATRVSAGYFLHDIEENEEVEFVWLDIACIDQRFNTESMLEIGRQAKIFSNAQCVYIWLSKTTGNILNKTFATIDKVSCGIMDYWVLDHCHTLVPALSEDGSIKAVRKDQSKGETQDEASHKMQNNGQEWLSNGLRAIEQLTSDPWFSSLWTLQEAFICKRAVFLSKEANIITLRTEGTDYDDIFTLTSVLTMSSHLQTYCQRNHPSISSQSQVSNEDSLARRVLDTIEDLGFIALNRENPMELYNAATSRRPRNETDNIYGIMQIFGFQLGESDPSSTPGTRFTLSQLEDQFGEALAKLNPVLSQAFIHTTLHRQVGKNWRPGPLSATPGSGFEGHIPWIPDGYNIGCELECRKQEGTVWGFLRGRSCSLATFQTARKAINIRLLSTDTAKTGFTDHTLAWMAIDWAPDLFPQWKSLTDYNFRTIFETTGAAEQLLAGLDPHKVKIFYLGSEKQASFDRTEIHYGLFIIQVNEKPKHWRRLGICGWRTRDETEQFEILVEELYGAGVLTSHLFDGVDVPNVKDASFINNQESFRRSWDSLNPSSAAHWAYVEGLFG